MGHVDGLTGVMTGAGPDIGRATALCFAAEGAQTSVQMLAPLHPIGRIGTPQDVAELIIRLCSSRASFVTGPVIPVDGGYIAQ